MRKPPRTASQALRKVPEVNASWNTDFIRQYHNIDVSVAVQTPGGLMVPILHDADALGLSEISAKVKDLATKVNIPLLCPGIQTKCLGNCPGWVGLLVVSEIYQTRTAVPPVHS